MSGKNRQVPVLADLYRADSLFQAELLGAVDGDGLERLFSIHAAVLDALGRFLIEMPHQLVAVRFEADRSTGLVKQGGVVWNGVERLDFISPPIRESAATGAMSSDFRRDLVTFQ